MIGKLDFLFGGGKAKAKNFEGVVKTSSDLLWIVVAFAISSGGRGGWLLYTRQ